MALFFYLAMLLLYMQPILGRCSTALLASPGDQSALTWLYTASPDKPLWGYTSWTNAPTGENLNQPLYITGALIYLPIWALTKIVSPICAYNIATSVGFLFTAMIMFGFVMWLTRKRNPIGAIIAGYVIAYNPYVLLKTPVHPSYAFNGILVGYLWSLFWLWRRPSWKKAVLVVIIGLASFYFDPYFVLLTAIMTLSFVIGSAAHEKIFLHSLRVTRAALKYIMLCVPLAVLLLSPIAYTKLKYGAVIDDLLRNSRSDIKTDAQVYGARPHEYMLPSQTNPLTPDFIKNFQLDNMHGSSIVENTLFIGYVPLGLVVLFFYDQLRRKRIRRLNVNEYRRVAVICLALIAIAGVFSMPPTISIANHRLPLPSTLLITLTETWRVLARLFILVEIAIAISAALGLQILIKRVTSDSKKVLIVGLILVFSIGEFLVYDPFQRSYWSYQDVPANYTKIKDNESIDTIAEYPLLDPPRNYHFVFYMAYQSFHKKRMINSGLSNSTSLKFRESLADIDDWQTPGVLKALGVDRLVVHSKQEFDLSERYILDQQGNDSKAPESIVKTLQIDNSIKARSYAITIGDGFDGPSNYGYQNIDFYMHGRGELNPVMLPGAKPASFVRVRIEFYGFNVFDTPVQVKQGDELITTIYPTTAKRIIELDIDSTKKVELIPSDKPVNYSFVISNMEIISP